MFRSKRTEQASLLEYEREMSSYVTLMLEDGSVDVEEVRAMFLDQFPGEESFFDECVQEYLG